MPLLYSCSFQPGRETGIDFLESCAMTNTRLECYAHPCGFPEGPCRRCCTLFLFITAVRSSMAFGWQYRHMAIVCHLKRSRLSLVVSSHAAWVTLRRGTEQISGERKWEGAPIRWSGGLGAFSAGLRVQSTACLGRWWGAWADRCKRIRIDDLVCPASNGSLVIFCYTE